MLGARRVRCLGVERSLVSLVAAVCEIRSWMVVWLSILRDNTDAQQPCVEVEIVSYGYGAIAGLYGMEMRVGVLSRVTFDAKQCDRS